MKQKNSNFFGIFKSSKYEKKNSFSILYENDFHRKVSRIKEKKLLLFFPLSIERGRDGEKKTFPEAASFVVDKLKSLVYGLDPLISHSTSRTSQSPFMFHYVEIQARAGEKVVSAV